MLPALRNRGPGHPVDTAQAPSQEILGQGCLWWPLLLRFLLNMKPVGSYLGSSPPGTPRSCPSGRALWDSDVTEKPRAGVRGELRRSHLNSGDFTEDGALRQRPCKCGVFPESEAHKHRRRPPALSLQAPSPCPPHPSGSLIIYLACQYLQKNSWKKRGSVALSWHKPPGSQMRKLRVEWYWCFLLLPKWPVSLSRWLPSALG